MLEQQEETIEQWYFDKTLREETSLEKYLCEEHVLKNQDSSCLREVYSTVNNDQSTTKSKGDAGNKDL